MDPISAPGLAGLGAEAIQSALRRPPIPATGADALSASAPGAGGIGDAAEGFEAIFLRQMLRDLRKTAAFDGESSQMTGFYTDMFDDFLAEHLAKAGGIGLAGAIQTYLKGTGQ